MECFVYKMLYSENEIKQISKSWFLYIFCIVSCVHFATNVSPDLRTFIFRFLTLFKCDSQRRFKEENRVMNRGREIHNVSYSVYTCVIYLHIMGNVYNMKIMLGDTIKIKMIYYYIICNKIALVNQRIKLIAIHSIS